MCLRQQHNISDLDVKIQTVAEEFLAADGAAAHVVAVRRRLVLGELDILRAHRHDHRGIPLNARACMHLDVA